MTVCVSVPAAHPERVVLLGQVGEDVRVEDHLAKEATPKRSQLGAELAHVSADVLRYLLVAVLQLFGREENARERESEREREREREREHERENTRVAQRDRKRDNYDYIIPRTRTLYRR